MTPERMRLERFVRRRNALIDDLDRGDVKRDEFLDQMQLLIRSSGLKPFSRIRTLEEGLFSYQYFNQLAKEELRKRETVPKDSKKDRYHSNRKDNYYCEKDKVISQLLELVGFREVEAYPIRLNSKSLKDTLIEIVFRNQEKVVLHTKDLNIRKRLAEHGCFSEKMRPSVIDAYVNYK